jgi:hypothetical protein
MSVRCFFIVQCLIAIFGSAMAPSARAQVCTASAPLPVNQTLFIDTCQQGDIGLQFVCGFEQLSGPALEFQVNVPYPMGQIQVQSANVDFDPVAFLIRGQCKSDAPCDAADYSAVPGAIRTIDLSKLDSGTYFLVVAPIASSSSSACGPVTITWSANLGDESIMQEGIFRGGTHHIVSP